MAVIFKITEVARPGQNVAGGGAVFEWTPDAHSSPQGDIPMALQVRTKTSNPMGTEEPTIQVLSSTLAPFEVSGEWSDRWGGPGFARRTWRDFEAMVRRGNLVRIDFMRIAIVGIVESFTPVLRTEDVVPWSFSFFPIKRDGDLGSSLARVARSVSGGVAKLLNVSKSSIQALSDAEQRADQMEELQDAGPRNQMGGEQFESAGERLTEIRAAIDSLSLANADSPLSATREGVASYRREISLHRKIRDSAEALIQDVGQVRADVDGAWDDTVGALLIEEWAAGLRYLARQQIIGAWRAERDLDRRAKSRPIARHRARRGESVYEISLLYYGTPDNWRRIHQANNLFLMEFEGGEDLLIPEVGEALG